MSNERDYTVPPQPPLRWGILSTGLIAHIFTQDLLRSGLKVQAVGSRHQASADKFAAEFSLPAAYGSYEALVADPEIDIVYVATPHPFHADDALLALRHGKHVLVEKPFTLNARQARSVVDEAKARNLVVLEAMWTRFLPHMARVREIIAAGTLGTLRTVMADHGQLLPTDPQHRLNNPALGGGALLDLGIYPVAFAVDILGLPTNITAQARLSATGVDAQTVMLFTHTTGAQALLQAALDALGGNRASIIGTHGRIEIPGVWYNAVSLDVYDQANSLIEHWEQPVVGRGMQYQAFEIERCIREGNRASRLLPPEQSVTIMAILDTVREQIGVSYPQEMTE